MDLLIKLYRAEGLISFKWCYIGDYMGDYYRCVIKEDTRSIGYSSSARSKAEAVLILQAAFQKIRAYSPP